MKKYIVLVFCLIPFLRASATIGEDINNLIYQFFGESPKVQTREKIDIDSSLGLESLQEQRVEEAKARDKAQEIIKAQEPLFPQIQEDVEKLENDIFLLEKQLQKSTKDFDNYEKLTQKWKEELGTLTQEKFEIKIQMRLLEKEYNDLLNKKFIQSKNVFNDQSLRALQWLFSTRSVAELLSDRKRQEVAIEQKARTLDRLAVLKKDLDNREKQIATLYTQIRLLALQMSNQKIVLNQIVRSKAQKRNQKLQEQSNIESILESAQERKIHAENYLDALEEAIETKKLKPSERVLDWPLKIPIEVTAFFEDKVYEDTLEKKHQGVDFLAPQGTYIYAPLGGVVKKVELKDLGYGLIVIDHGEELYSLYGHISESFVAENEPVTKGKIIGKTGGTPGTRGSGFFSSGPHLHFEVSDKGQIVDPLKYLPQASS